MGTMTLLSQFSSRNTFLPGFPLSHTVIHFTHILSWFPAINPYSQRESAEFQRGEGEAPGSTMAAWNPLQNCTSQEGNHMSRLCCVLISQVCKVMWLQVKRRWCTKPPQLKSEVLSGVQGGFRPVAKWSQPFLLYSWRLPGRRGCAVLSWSRTLILMKFEANIQTACIIKGKILICTNTHITQLRVFTTCSYSHSWSQDIKWRRAYGLVHVRCVVFSFSTPWWRTCSLQVPLKDQRLQQS